MESQRYKRLQNLLYEINQIFDIILEQTDSRHGVRRGAPWLRSLKLQIGMPREHHELPRLPSARFAAPTATRAIAVARRGYLLGLRESNFKQEWQNNRHETLTRHDYLEIVEA